MKEKKGQLVLQIFIQIFIFQLMGIILIGGYIVDPNNTLFTFTLYGIATIVFYYLLLKGGVNKFLIYGTLFTIVLLFLFKHTNETIIMLRNILWYIFIGLLSYWMYKHEQKKSKLYLVASWFVGYIIVYIIMLIFNVYVFKFYKINHNTTVVFYILQSIKIGGVLGLGIGIGKIISDFLFLNKFKIVKA